MSEDQEDPDKLVSLMRSFYVPRTEYDLTKDNVERRLVGLRKDVDGVITGHDELDRRIGATEGRVRDAETEHRVNKAERIGLLAIVQSMDSVVKSMQAVIGDTASTVHKIEHLQMLGWAIVAVLIVSVLIKVW